MITKSYAKTGRACRVTFEIPAGQARCERAAVLGDFNDWNPEAHPMERRQDGSLAATVSLPIGHSYRFRYLLDGDRWENDAAADATVPNVFGSEDSVLALEDAPAPRPMKAGAKPRGATKAAKVGVGTAPGGAGVKPRGAKKATTPPAEPGSRGARRTPRRSDPSS